ncbi:thioredoxin-like domain-containing protein [uncultured Jatrophihabitans sp.]|uniref:thioredoxin-like domain-containing protein n=1 Tax=uncultured Jatrophihabitans sp. TaxID=1610747 RepID=UPI0035CBBE1E
MDALRTGPRVRAPELIDGDWFNAAAPLTLKGLRGRFVLLDFWASCCGNCLHVLDELRSFEAAYEQVLTVIGVHSPKFPHEAEPSALAAAIERYDIGHPVLNDPGLELWRQYAVRAWPTLVLVDPEGYVVAQAAGEGQVSALAAVVDRLSAEHEARGTLRSADAPRASRNPQPQPGALRFPAKAVVLPAERTGRAEDTLLVADAGHHDVVELAADGETVLRRIGNGARGEPFAEPNGLALLPAGVVPDVDVLVADTANHVLRGIRLADGTVTRSYDLPAALAGARTVTGAIPTVLSPWDVAWWPAIERAVVAAAGVHLLLAVDVRTGATDVLAGTTVEGLRDGRPLDAWLAQPSGLAVDGARLWFVDAESSALRFLDADGELGTVVGEGLFDFGHVDGPAADARLQHPLGVTVLPDGSVAVLDTYNGAVRRYDPVDDNVTTLTDELAEPSGALLLGGELVVVESAAHRLVRPVPAARVVSDPPQRSHRPPAELATGAVTLTVTFTPAPGRVLDERHGPATALSVTASPPELLLDGGGESSELVRQLRLASGTGVLQVVAQAASCDDDPAVDHPACHLARQDWGVPVVVGPGGAASLNLPLLG